MLPFARFDWFSSFLLEQTITKITAKETISMDVVPEVLITDLQIRSKQTPCQSLTQQKSSQEPRVRILADGLCYNVSITEIDLHPHPPSALRCYLYQNKPRDNRQQISDVCCSTRIKIQTVARGSAAGHKSLQDLAGPDVDLQHGGQSHGRSCSPRMLMQWILLRNGLMVFPDRSGLYLLEVR